MKSHFLSGILVLFLFVVVTSSLSAQSTISGDRPGFGVSSANLPKGGGQVETGFQWFRQYYELPVALRDERSTYLDNQTTLRYGITDWLEIKSDLSFGQVDHSASFWNDQAYFSAPGIGTRVRLWEGGNKERALFYGTITLPFLASNPKPDVAITDLRFLYTQPIHANWVVDINVGGVLPHDFSNVRPPKGSLSYAHYVIAATWSICPGWNLFGEYYGTSDFNRATGWIDGGIIFNPSIQTQVDLSGALLIHESDNVQYPGREVFFLSAGFAWRFRG